MPLSFSQMSNWVYFQVFKHINVIQQLMMSDKLDLWTWGDDNDIDPEKIRKQETVGGVTAFITNNIPNALIAQNRSKDINDRALT